MNVMKLAYTVHTAWILKSPPDPIFHERGQSLFLADAIMYMYVNNLTVRDSRYTMYASVKWRG